MRERDPGISGDAERGGDAGNHLEGNAGVCQSFGFLPAAAEYEGIATLQPYHVQTAPAALDQHFADLVLRGGVLGFLLADVNALCRGRRQIEQLDGREVIVEHRIGLLENASGFEGDEFGIAWTG